MFVNFISGNFKIAFQQGTFLQSKSFKFIFIGVLQSFDVNR